MKTYMEGMSDIYKSPIPLNETKAQALKKN
jgi:hypothetical protein